MMQHWVLRRIDPELRDMWAKGSSLQTLVSHELPGRFNSRVRRDLTRLRRAVSH